MWFLIFIAAGIWFLYQVGKTAQENTKKPVNTNDYNCLNVPPGKAARHKWVLKFPGGESDHRGYLICKVCKKEPGLE